MINPLAKNVLVHLGLTAAASAAVQEYIENLRIRDNDTNNIKR